MAKIKKSAPSAMFTAISNAAANMGEDNDCAVRTVALVTNKPYVDAHSMLVVLGRKFRGGAKASVIKKAINGLGKQLIPIEQRSIIQQYTGNHSGLKHVTSHHPARFPKVWKDGCAYVCFTVNHVFAIIDGVTHDWSANRALRIISIYRVEAKAPPPSARVGCSCQRCQEENL